jgi:hypothetical protein
MPVVWYVSCFTLSIFVQARGVQEDFGVIESALLVAAFIAVGIFFPSS